MAQYSVIAGQTAAESSALLLLWLGWLVVGVLWLRVLRRRRGKAKTSRWLPVVTIFLGPLVGAALWAWLVYSHESDATEFERLDILPLFLGMGFFVGLIVAGVLAASRMFDDAEPQHSDTDANIPEESNRIEP